MTKLYKTIITVVAVLSLTGFVTQAQAYTERWVALDEEDPFSSFELVYNDNNYTYVVGAADGYLADTTSGSNDVFNGWSLTWTAKFSCDEVPGDTIWISGQDFSTTVSKVVGTKPTGRSGIDTTNSGCYWYGHVLHRGSDHIEQFDCGGTWSGSFNYNNSPATCTFEAVITGPQREGRYLEGSGSGEGYCIYYQ